MKISFHVKEYLLNWKSVEIRKVNATRIFEYEKQKFL